MNEPLLLIATVGGAPEPVVASLLYWRPVRAIFVVSPETRDSVAERIVPAARSSGLSDFDSGRYDLHEVKNAQDYTALVDDLRLLDDRIAAWQRDHPGAKIIADFTGGTKAMSASLALIAGHWQCIVSYVGGTERTKDGVGIVVSGKEQIVHFQNPADALGLSALDTARELLRLHSFSAAAAILDRVLHRVTSPSRKAELSAVSTLAQALAQWDRFEHQGALTNLGKLQRRQHDLEAALGVEAARNVLSACRQLQVHLEKLLEHKDCHSQTTISRSLILDLLANAGRRIEECRWDDATARLYRAIEATAQLHLADLGIATEAVPLERIPTPLRDEFAPRATGETAKFGLQEAWRLLNELRPETAKAFFESGLGEKEKSPLTSRNQSILAHGFAPVSEKVTRALWTAALAIAEVKENELPKSPCAGIPPTSPSSTSEP